MGKDIPRYRKHPQASLGVAPESLSPELHRPVGEIHAQIEDLARRIAALEVTTADPIPVPQPIERKVRENPPVPTPQVEAWALYCRAQNTGTTTISKFQPAVVRGQAFDYDDPRVLSLMLLEVSAITASDDGAAFVIPTQDIAADGIGKVVLAGCTLALVSGTGARATVDGSSSTTQLVCGDSGEAEVLWSGSGYGLIRFPSGGGGGGEFGTPVALSGSTPRAGTGEMFACSTHQHGIPRTQTGHGAASFQYEVATGYLNFNSAGTWIRISHSEE